MIFRALFSVHTYAVSVAFPRFVQLSMYGNFVPPALNSKPGFRIAPLCVFASADVVTRTLTLSKYTCPP